MVMPEHEQDDPREKLKDAATQRGRQPDAAPDVAAREAKWLRQREGRSQDDDSKKKALSPKSAKPNTEPAEPAGGQSDPPDSVFQKGS